ncbi:hypothetical protein HNQ51_002862 [Inhella inkyongensis]|uniref:Esterase n=1 Tax=Inhella inkyongensis TaxID=392593 RepID=A0A840S788_9BURK|nr:alpha/beta hydrolase-fold protein [Inhella inkyongensis]MBB5205543.1 hypothetical protein [Inhella inkyongensis]
MAGLLAAALHLGPLGLAAAPALPELKERADLRIGDSLLVDSRVMGEARRINVYTPQLLPGQQPSPLPLLLVLDGGMGEDFLHIAGLLQVGVANGSVRPFRLVGIENTERRRDLTGPTQNEDDRKMAPRVGGSERFRRFVRDEVLPLIEARYPSTAERALMGESLAGLFVFETLLQEPQLFDHYIAIDPSLWWNDKALLAQAAKGIGLAEQPKHLFMAYGADMLRGEAPTRAALQAGAQAGLRWRLELAPDEGHSTLYHPMALKALRALLKPAEAPKP